jgi:hypothetical protein
LFLTILDLRMKALPRPFLAAYLFSFTKVGRALRAEAARAKRPLRNSPPFPRASKSATSIGEATIRDPPENLKAPNRTRRNAQTPSLAWVAAKTRDCRDGRADKPFGYRFDQALETALCAYEGALLLINRDERFLNAVTNKIWRF